MMNIRKNLTFLAVLASMILSSTASALLLNGANSTITQEFDVTPLTGNITHFAYTISAADGFGTDGEFDLSIGTSSGASDLFSKTYVNPWGSNFTAHATAGIGPVNFGTATNVFLTITFAGESIDFVGLGLIQQDVPNNQNLFSAYVGTPFGEPVIQPEPEPVPEPASLLLLLGSLGALRFSRRNTAR